MNSAKQFVKRYLYVTLFFCIGVPAYFGVEHLVNLWRNPQAKVASKAIEGDLPEFALVNQEGRRFYRSSLKDKVTLVNFVFRSCPHACPLLMGQTKKAVQLIRSNRDILQVASITVDPNNDSQEVLKEWKEEFMPEMKNWYFLRTTREALIELVRVGFKLPVERTQTEQHGPILHSSKVVLIDHKATIRGYFSVETAEERQTLAQAYEALSAESKTQASL